MKGGYQVINFGGKVIDTTSKTVPGAYKKASTRKAVLVEDIKFSSEMSTVSGFSAPILTSNGYELTIIAHGLAGVQAVVITIADNDGVTAEFVTLAEAD